MLLWPLAGRHSWAIPPLSFTRWLALLPLPPAGDQYTGTAWDSLYTQKGNFSVAELLNMMNFDAMVRVPTCACALYARMPADYCSLKLPAPSGGLALQCGCSLPVLCSCCTPVQAVGNHEFDYGPSNLAGFASVLTTALIRWAAQQQRLSYVACHS